jgi:SAM-dependent methyltransferase
MPRFLHVGCGKARKDRTTPVFSAPEWDEVRLDISPEVQPDIVASMTDMAMVETGTMDALYASNTLEHLFLHEVPIALAEFLRVLTPQGHAVLSVPDLQAVAKLVAEGKLLDAMYMSPAGPISAHDTLYGHGASVAAGAVHMAHRCGFTAASLSQLARQAGFATVMVRQHAGYQLTAVACRAPTAAEPLRGLMDRHRPR